MQCRRSLLLANRDNCALKEWSVSCRRVLLIGMLICAGSFVSANLLHDRNVVGQDRAEVAPVDTASKQDRPPEGFFEILFSGGPVGVAIMLVLIALSLTATYLIFEQLLTLRKRDLLPDELAESLRGLVAAGRLAEADQLCRTQPSLLSFIVMQGLAERTGGWWAVEKSMEEALAEQAARLFRKVEYLSVIGNIAPMVGLLGTVTGMIMAFHRVAATSGAAGAPELAEGIYQALVTTVVGLIIAIPSLGAFAIFRNRVDELAAEAAYMAQHVMAPLKQVHSPMAVTPPPAPPGVRP
jgi:biopolymer transport protein ExbB